VTHLGSSASLRRSISSSSPELGSCSAVPTRRSPSSGTTWTGCCQPATAP